MITRLITRTIAVLTVFAVCLGLFACSKNTDSTDIRSDKTVSDTTIDHTDDTAPVSNDEDSGFPVFHSALTEDSVPLYDYSEKAMEYLNYIGTELADRSSGTEGHDKCIEWIKSELTAAGYDPEQIKEQSFNADSMYLGKVSGTNIILTVPGDNTSGQIIVGAHFDGGGIGDNGSGVALLLATAVKMHDVQLPYTVKYVFFDCEEAGMVGSREYVNVMSDEEIDSTLFMINIDSIAFGDFCNVYGGCYDGYDDDYNWYTGDDRLPDVEMTEGYDLAMDVAAQLGIKVYRTEDLDGYYAEHGGGMPADENSLFTNPWTNDNPAPRNYCIASPCTLPASDHVAFTSKGIRYIYFEATNWWAGEQDPYSGYTGYIETYDETLGDGGMFMNTEYDTLENLDSMFPGRAKAHFELYSRLLSALLMVQADDRGI